MGSEANFCFNEYLTKNCNFSIKYHKFLEHVSISRTCSPFCRSLCNSIFFLDHVEKWPEIKPQISASIRPKKKKENRDGLP